MGAMRPVEAPAPGGPLQRSVAACLAAILEVDPADVPVPDTGHPEPWTVWRTWLAQRGLGLVPLLAPATFNWPGPWIAVLGDGAEQVGVVAFGAPPGMAWHPLGGPETLDGVTQGYVVAPADVALWTPAPADASVRRSGRVEAIVVAPEAAATAVRVTQATARAGRGLDGDRYGAGRGTFSNVHSRGHDLTLIEAEALEALDLPTGHLDAEGARRNVVTRGIDLNALVGEHFTIGEITCVGRRLCEPCAHLARLAERAGATGTLRALIHRGGLRADVLTDGTIRVGDAVAVSAAAG